MKTVVATLAVLTALSGVSFGAEKAYQVTGPVLELRDDAIVVQKGKEKWEIGKDSQTKVTGDPKVGSKVTVHYVMKAKSIEGKSEAKKK